MGSGGGGGGNGGEDKNRGVERGRTKQPSVAVSKPAVSRPTGGKDRPDFGVVKRKVSTVAPKPAPKPTINEAKEARIGPAKELAKSFEATKAARKKTGDPTARVDVYETPTSFSEKVAAKEARGPSPGDVMATFGSVAGVNRDIVAANVAGRPGLNVENMGDLASRARGEGQLPAGKITVPGAGTAALNLLNLAGKKSAMSILTKIAKDQPVIKDGKVTYSTEIVKDDRGSIVGIVEPGPIKGTRVYSGRPEFNPLRGDEPKQEPEPVFEPEAPVVEDVTQDTLLAPTKKRARGTRSKRFAGETLLEGGGVLYK